MNTGIILLEGPDGTGKTTLAKHLTERYDAVYLHQSYRFKDKMWEYHTAVLHRAVDLSMTRLVVLDRLWLSECLYARALRGGTAWPHEGRMMDRVLRRFGAVTVVCLAGENHERQFQELRKVRLELFDSMMQVSKMYDETFYGNSAEEAKDYAGDLARDGGLVGRREYASYRVWVEGRDVENFCRYLVARVEGIREDKLKCILDPKFTNFLGDLETAELVFVGDQVNPKFHKISWPFYDYGDSSLYLANVLSELGFDERRAVWVNANDPQDDAFMAILDRGLKPIIFGDRALKTWRKFSSDGNSVMHPQAVRRFHSKDDRFWRCQLGELLK